MTAAPTLLPGVLLLEPQFVLRRTVVGLARKLEMAEVLEATSAGTAVALLRRKPFDALVLDLADPEGVIALLRQLRLGEFPSARDVAVCLTAAAPLAPALQATTEALGIAACLHKPYRISSLLEALGLKAR
ncbi:MAG TPA: response regulator [Ideonella sp.]|uniref:response regulator n=1 Tax=Ideonella sp. TaxID=1929293 RepID=UPI002BE5E9DA|nr:response regulator [Ideonella sp.]HSI50185.1 response regulator [Ideonella sp.]